MKNFQHHVKFKGNRELKITQEGNLSKVITKNQLWENFRIMDTSEALTVLDAAIFVEEPIYYSVKSLPLKKVA